MTQIELEAFPTDPGVYIMKDIDDRVIYVGKANNLKRRLSDYFSNRDVRITIPFLISKIHDIETIVVSSEREALLLENTLIKKYQPKYNILLKDDKTFISLYINSKNEWPTVKVVRHKVEVEQGNYFGPYTDGAAARRTLELLFRIFPLRSCSDNELKRRTRPCILYSMKRCVAPCVNKCTHEEYQNLVEGVKKFLRGHDKELIKSLKEQMQIASDALDFEQADHIHRSLEHIERVVKSKQAVYKIGGGKLDAIGFTREGSDVVISKVIQREGKVIASDHFHFHGVVEENDDLLNSFLLQHYKNKEVPDEILIPFMLEDQNILAEIIKVEIHFPKLGTKKALVEIANKNASSSLKRELDKRIVQDSILLKLQHVAKLTHYPGRIECFDVSNIAGTDTVGSLVAFTNGRKDKKRFRLFTLNEAAKGDDYGAMHILLKRRLSKAKEMGDLPDLIIVDGGKGQLSVAKEVMQELNIATVDVIGLAKESSRHDMGLTQERIFTIDSKEPVVLGKDSELLFFLQRVRDESHRTAIEFHKKRRSKRVIKTELTQIKGFGPIKSSRLLKHFGSIAKIKEATPEELLKIKGITSKDVEVLKQALG